MTSMVVAINEYHYSTHYNTSRPPADAVVRKELKNHPLRINVSFNSYTHKILSENFYLLRISAEITVKSLFIYLPIRKC